MENEFPKMRDRYTLDHFISVLPPRIPVLVEIGSYAGESMEAFIQSGKVIEAFAVDPWVGGWSPTDPADYRADMRAVEAAFDKRMLPYNNVTKMKMTSATAVVYFLDESVDLVYIDANHSYEFVRQDIELWLPKIRQGGIISGHDYGFTPHAGVKQAVDEAFGEERIERFNDYSWKVNL